MCRQHGLQGRSYRHSKGSPGNGTLRRRQSKEGLTTQHWLKGTTWRAKSTVSHCSILSAFRGKIFCTSLISKREYIRESVIQTALLLLQTGNYLSQQQPQFHQKQNKTNQTKTKMFGDYQGGKCIFQAFRFSQGNVTIPFVSLKNGNPFKVLAPSAE